MQKIVILPCDVIILH